ncbi:hypothetical protein FRB93_012328 [Tulasnella sp. JGI-2019a]|nr:hypothetical protein FRB93_012328 [Tulasnella sp. JGI-2019a]
MAAPLSVPRRHAQLTLNLATLPAITMPSPIINEKGSLPCIMVTPSSPAHDTNFEIFYFTPEQKPYRRGFFSNIREVFSSFTPTYHRIALPESPNPDETPLIQPPTSYGRIVTPRSSWSATKRLRAFLMILGAIFFALHLVIIPQITGGVFNVFRQEQDALDQTYGSAKLWEGWEAAPIVKGSEEPVMHIETVVIHDIPTPIPDFDTVVATDVPVSEPTVAAAKPDTMP